MTGPDPRMILVVTDSMDDTANAVVAGLERSGARWGRFNLAEFPERARVVFDPADPGGALILDETGDAIEVKAIRTTWIWHPRPFKLVPDLDRAQARFVAAACHETSRLMMALLRGRSFMVNAPEAESAANDKGLQLRVDGRICGEGMAVQKGLIDARIKEGQVHCFNGEGEVHGQGAAAGEACQAR